jgi:hypothetical protein
MIIVQSIMIDYSMIWDSLLDKIILE